MPIVRHAIYLGVDMGPGAASVQWRSVSEMIRAGVLDIGHAPSLAGKVILFNMCISSLLRDEAQFAEFSREVLQTCWHATPTVSKMSMAGVASIVC